MYKYNFKVLRHDQPSSPSLKQNIANRILELQPKKYTLDSASVSIALYRKSNILLSLVSSFLALFDR